MADTEEGDKETPCKFLDGLWEALHEFIDVDLKVTEGEMILKDRFLTQSAPDICRKLLKQAYGPNQSLDNLFQLAQSITVGNMRERKKGRERPRTGGSPCNGCQNLS